MNIIEEMQTYCDIATKGTLASVLRTMSERQLRTLIDGYYEGGFDAWKRDLIPAALPTNRNQDPALFNAGIVRRLMGRLPRLSVGERIVIVKAFDYDGNGDLVEVALDYNTPWRVQYGTVFTLTTDGKTRERETAQIVSLKTYDMDPDTGEYVLNKAFSFRQTDSTFVGCETAGQYARIFDATYWLDKGEQDRLCSNPGDMSWLDPRHRAKSLSPMGTDARYVRTLDRIV